MTGLLFCHRQAIHVDVQEVVGADAPDAVRGEGGLGRRMDNRPVDDEVNFVGLDPDLERVHRLAVGVGNFDGGVRDGSVAACARETGEGRLRGIAVPGLDQPDAERLRPAHHPSGIVLGDHEIGVLLVPFVEICAPENEAEVIDMAAALVLGERGLERVIAGHNVGRIPEHGGGRRFNVVTGPGGQKFDGAGFVWVRGAGASVLTLFPTGGDGLSRERGGGEESQREDDYWYGFDHNV